MIFKRAALFLGLLAFASPAWAGSGEPVSSQDIGTKAGAGGQPEVILTDLAPRLKPRPIASERLRVPEYPTGRIVVKFNDELRVRLTDERSVRAQGNLAVDPINQVIKQFDLVLHPAFTQSEDRIQSVLRRAEQHSGRMQPDLGGMMYVDVERSQLLAAARALNDLPQVEWAEIEEQRFLGAAPAAMAGVNGACCLPGSCVVVTEAACTMLGGNFQGNGTDCTGGCGACCLGDGTCVLATLGGCNSVGGNWTGSGVACPLGGCGGCCLPGPAQLCVNTTPGVCTAAGGVFQGGGVVCGGAFLCGACCIPSGDPEVPADCEVALELSCVETIGGVYTADGTLCSAVDCDDLTNEGCGSPTNGGCFVPGGNGTPFCDDDACCNLVCEGFDPFCCDEVAGEWDAICVYTANLICATPPNGGADRCATIFNDSCFEPHPGGGCNDEACCNLVCAIDPGCCTNDWDGSCVLIALQLCAGAAGADDPTPDFEALQGYLAAGPVNPFAFTGYTGEGLNLRTPGEPFDDLNGNGWWDPGEPFDDDNGDGFWTAPGGVYGLAEELLYVYGIDETSMGNLSRGRSIRIGVIEWSFYQGHEDLDVWVEPGQTLIVIPEVGEPDHGTASLGVAGAREDGIGVTGVAPDAMLMFFPLTSVEEGPRESAAWFSALEVLRAGDVISCSYGPPANLNNTLATWTFIRLAADLGITACIAAGNGCLNLDGAPDLGDSGGIVVGATSPGAPHFRLAFSNYYIEPDPAWERSNVVHVNSWGTNVATTGYGDLFIPEGPAGADFNRLRSYTAGYGGTSAAAPQVAGVVAVLQGFAKQFYGIPLTTDRIRGTIAADAPAPTLRGGPAGFEPDQGCSLDTNPDEGPHRVGGYPNLAGDFGSATSAILNQTGFGFDDSPLLENILVLRGQRLSGNRFSVKGLDENYLVVESRFVNRGNPLGNQGLDPNFEANPVRGTVDISDVPEAASVTYLGSGQVTDVIAIGRSDLENPTQMGVTVFFGQIDIFQIAFLEAYNWTTGRWQFLGLGLLNPGPEGLIDGGALNAGSFIRDDDGRILVRVWNLGFGLNSPQLGASIFRTRIDLIGIDVDTGL